MTATRALTLWLGMCAFLVFLMIVVGGLTRLTESGLSIVEWQPVRGVLPPMNDADWNELFGKYQRTPQYQKINHGMTLDAFKGIFWLEFIHRLLGRVIGIVFLIPLVYFVVKKAVSPALAWRLTTIFLLGGVQGAVGWYMVQSGLVDQPAVSAYRLAFHLGMGFLLFGLIFWTVLDVLPSLPSSSRTGREYLFFSYLITLLVFLQVLLGALVAGLDAGLAYNTFPTMNGEWIPDGIWMLEPTWRNFFENPTLVQFNHRVMAAIVILAVPIFAWRGWKQQCLAHLRHAFAFLLVMLLIQITLGILTLLHQVPVALASLHQAGAVILFAVSLRIAHGLGRTSGRIGNSS